MLIIIITYFAVDSLVAILTMTRIRADFVKTGAVVLTWCTHTFIDIFKHTRSKIQKSRFIYFRQKVADRKSKKKRMIT